MVIVLTPEANKVQTRNMSGAQNFHIFQKVLESNALINKSSEYDIFLPWLGTGLLLASGEKWRGRRKMMTPSFHFNVLIDFQVVFNSQSMVCYTEKQEFANWDFQILLEQIENAAKKTDDSSIDAFPYIKRCALDIICGK